MGTNTYATSLQALEEAYLTEISRWQSTCDDPTLLESAYDKLKRKYEYSIKILRENRLMEGYEEGKATLQKEYQEFLQGMEEKKAAFIRDQMAKLGVGHDDALSMANTEFEGEIAKKTTDLQKRFDALRTEFDIPPGEVLFPEIPITEGVVEQWWEKFKELFTQHANDIERKVGDLVSSPERLKDQIGVVERIFQKKETEGAFPAEVSEGFLSWLNPLNIPVWFWRNVYLRWLDSRWGWLRDKFWLARVRQKDPTANPGTFVIPDAFLKTKEEYSAFFYAALTVAFFMSIAYLVHIPIVSGFLEYIFMGAKEIILGLV